MIKFFGIFIAVAAFISPARAEILTFCYDPYPPYTLGTEGAPSGGIKVDILEAIAERLDGVTVEITLLPWQRCQAQTEAGVYDGILPLFQNDARRKYLTFSDSVLDQTSSLWFRASPLPEGVEWSGQYEDIAHLRLGMLNGSFINHAMEAAFTEGGGIFRARDTVSLFRMLERGRVDFVAIDDSVARYQLAELGLNAQVRQLLPVIAKAPAYFGLSKRTGADTRYLAAFNTILGELTRSGVIDDILNDPAYQD